jgi:hypothetical protein
MPETLERKAMLLVGSEGPYNCFLARPLHILQETHGVTSQKMVLFIVTAMKIPNFTYLIFRNWHM